MKVLVRNHQAAGDVLMLTAALRDLHRAHPDRFLTAVDTTYPQLWENNPHVTSRQELGRPDRVIDCEYPLVHEANHRPYHFIHGFAQDLERKLHVSIPLSAFRGDLHLSVAERRSDSPVRAAGHRGPYWVVVAGGKNDFTAKWWNPDSYQAVVDHFAGRIQFVQCGEAGDRHPPLRGVIDLVGKTCLRELIRLIYHCDGVICPVTFAMHLAAAVPPRPGARLLKPCVVIAGGREPPHWEMYPGHQFLHTVGALDCCGSGGCWKSRCQPVGDGDPKDDELCLRPVRVRDDLHVGRCMTLIPPARVIEAVELYCDPGAPRLAFDASRTQDSAARRAADPDLDVRPRGVAVTIGVGHFGRMAQLAAREVRAMTGLDTVVLDSDHFTASRLEAATMLKFRLFELVKADNIFYFDADMVCLERWDPRRYFALPEIVAVRERMCDGIIGEARDWGVPPHGYFNGGMFIANSERHREWLRQAEAIRFLKPTSFFDQSPLNAARCRLGIALKLLDRRFNWLGFGGSSLGNDTPVILAHKLVPDQIDANVKYLDGEYDLVSSTLVYDEVEADRLAARTVVWIEEGQAKRTLVLREDGTILPPAAPDAAGYWFVHVVGGRPTLALASETAILHQFVETVGGDWISTAGDDVRLVDEAGRRSPPLTPENARGAAHAFLRGVPPYPAYRYSGRGVVICGGGATYLPCAWVCIHILRHLGCRLPIELWQLTRCEINDAVRSDLERIGVRCVNAGEVRQRHPVRFLSGWELKSFSILYSSFEQVLYLDADNVPVLDPTFLFDTGPFRDTGAVFWPDYGQLTPDRSIWEICGVPYRDEPEFESGQMLIDKSRCWRALQLTLHMNEHSDFYYRHVHGDKETFHMAWRMLGQDYAMVPHPIVALERAMCQHDFDGRRLFQHRNLAKWSPTGTNLKIEGFRFEDLCLGFVDEFARRWGSRF